MLTFFHNVPVGIPATSSQAFLFSNLEYYFQINFSSDGSSILQFFVTSFLKKLFLDQVKEKQIQFKKKKSLKV